jgi:hypothetical protein
LSSQSQVQPGDTPAIVSLKGKSDDAIKAGRLAEAEAILAQIDAEQSKQEILLRENRARTAETRGNVAMQRIRYVDAPNCPIVPTRESCCHSSDSHKSAEVAIFRGALYSFATDGKPQIRDATGLGFKRGRRCKGAASQKWRSPD